jgi:hypothetical protein
VEIFMVMRNLCLVVILAIVAGCQSAPTVNPYPEDWLIDDFEDGDGETESHGFAAPLLDHWECRPKDSTHPISECKVTADPEPDPDHPQNKVLHLGSTLGPIEDGGEFTRSEVATFIDPPRDLTAYKEFSLKVKLVGREAQPRLKFQLSCVQVRAAGGGISPNPCILRYLEKPPGRSWGTYGLDLAVFAPPDALNDGEGVAPSECLAHVDGIKITVDSESNVPAGQTWTFDLYVDDIAFIPPNN